MTAKKSPATAGQIRALIQPSGRVQATRHDPSQGQKDRLRGWRAKGGARKGRRTFKGGDL